MNTSEKKTVLLVDDEPTNLRVLKQVLGDTYRLVFAKNGAQAIKLANQDPPDLILMDIMMPEMTGLEACTRLKAEPATRSIPIIFITALNDELDEAAGLEVGAVDYITKPISPAVVTARVKTHLSLVQANELRETRQQIIQCLGRASEYKDNETGLHILRMSHYSHILALAFGFSDEKAYELLQAAPMHDIGKIGIPDYIMTKPAKLSDEEFKIMQQHPLIGAEILGDCNSSLMKLAKSVSLHHHEKWNGKGYPKGLKGEEIPIEGRIVAIADVFDALTSKRPYKEAWPVEEAMTFIISQSGEHFDPVLVTLLEDNLDKILEIKRRWPDD
jgi:putative two-component system response regulator